MYLGSASSVCTTELCLAMCLPPSQKHIKHPAHKRRHPSDGDITFEDLPLCTLGYDIHICVLSTFLCLASPKGCLRLCWGLTTGWNWRLTRRATSASLFRRSPCDLHPLQRVCGPTAARWTVMSLSSPHTSEREADGAPSTVSALHHALQCARQNLCTYLP